MAIGTPSGSSLAQAANVTFVETTITVSVNDTIFVIGQSNNASAGAPPAQTATDQTDSETVDSQFKWDYDDETGLSVHKLNLVANAGTKTMRIANAESTRKAIQVHKNTATGGFTKDQDTSGTGTGISATSGSTATTTVADEYILGVGADTFNRTLTTSSPWVNLSNSGSSRPVTRVDYQIVSSTGAYAYTGSWSSSSASWLMGIGTFYETGGGAATSLPPRRKPLRHLLVR